MTQSILQVDAFADKPFIGNPAGVCILDKAADETWMQNVAMELNLSENRLLVSCRNRIQSPLVYTFNRSQTVRPCYFRFGLCPV